MFGPKAVKMARAPEIINSLLRVSMISVQIANECQEKVKLLFRMSFLHPLIRSNLDQAAPLRTAPRSDQILLAQLCAHASFGICEAI